MASGVGLDAEGRASGMAFSGELFAEAMAARYSVRRVGVLHVLSLPQADIATQCKSMSSSFKRIQNSAHLSTQVCWQVCWFD